MSEEEHQQKTDAACFHPPDAARPVSPSSACRAGPGVPLGLLDYALRYARRGLRVLPLHSIHSGECSCGRDGCSSQGKHPRTRNGVKDATSNEAQIQQWWQWWPEANIGVATGNGLFVIDIDSAKGADLTCLQRLGLARLLTSVQVRTGSGGLHLHVHTPIPLPNSASKLGPFIDTRGEGGYVVMPPSRNKDGRYVPQTRVPILMLNPDEVALLQQLLGGPRSAVEPQQQPVHHQKEEYSTHDQLPRATQTAAAAVHPAQIHQDAAGVASSVSAGVATEARNVYLISMAGNLRQRGLTVHEMRGMLMRLNEDRYGQGQHPRGPLSLDELERTIFTTLLKWEQEQGVLQGPASARIYSLTDLMRMNLPEPFWVVPGLLCEGLSVLGGKPKIGKSWLLLALALICAIGTANGGGLVLGRYPVESCGVLYLSLEDTARRFQSRVLKLLDGRAVPENFGYALQWKPLNAGGLLDLEAALLERPAVRLVVIDTLARARAASLSKGNAYLEDYTFMSDLKALADRHHLALVLIHHLRKSESEDSTDEFSGTTGFTGAADGLLKLKANRGQPSMRLDISGRDLEKQELLVAFAKESCTWTCLGDADAQPMQSQSKREILDLLAQKGEMTSKEISEALDKPYGTIASTVYRLAKEGILTRQRRGQYALTRPEEQADIWEKEERE